MIYEGRSFFSGELDGKTIKNFFINKYDLLTAEERIAAVNELLETDFFNEYFDKHFKVKLTSGDQLSSGINVCQTLEKLADYILNCQEVKDERKTRNVEYRFYKNKAEFFERTKNDTACSDDVLDFLQEEGKNFYLSNNQVITKEDLNENSECGEILRQYDMMLENCKKMTSFNKMLRNSKSVREDMLITKNQLKGTIEVSGSNTGKHFSTYDSFDWKNPNHVKELFTMHRDFHPEDNLSHLLLSLENYIEEMYKCKKLTETEYKIIKALRKGYKQVEISEILKIKKSMMNQLIRGISRKISKFANN